MGQSCEGIREKWCTQTGTNAIFNSGQTCPAGRQESWAKPPEGWPCLTKPCTQSSQGRMFRITGRCLSGACLGEGEGGGGGVSGDGCGSNVSQTWDEVAQCPPGVRLDILCVLQAKSPHLLYKRRDVELHMAHLQRIVWASMGSFDTRASAHTHTNKQTCIALSPQPS